MKKTSKLSRLMELLSVSLFTGLIVAGWGTERPLRLGLYIAALAMVGLWIVVDT